jgi:hypothetical protein
LAASREDLQEDLEWNVTLRDAIPDAFAMAVRYFNALGPDTLGSSSWARYNWPDFLRYSRDDAFWKQVTTSIAENLQALPVFETRGGTFERFKDLLYIPHDYRTENGKLPRIDLQSRLKSHLSFRYDDEESEPLTLLQKFPMKKMTPAVVRQDLEEFMGNAPPLCDGRVFATVDSAWREMVASMFKHRDIQRQLKQLQQMPLVPIQKDDNDNAWVNPSKSIFFNADRVPVDDLAADLDLRIVDMSRCAAEWKRLLEELGVHDLDQAAVIREIWSQHQKEGHKRKFLNWIRDVIFLFRVRSHIPEDLDLTKVWFLAHDNKKRLRGSEIYLEGCHLVPGPDVLSKSYFNILAEEDQADFLAWLEDACGVSREPRMLCDGQLTPDWAFLAQQRGDELLVYLRDHPGTAQEATIRQALSSIMVSVRGQADTRIRLGSTALPTSDLLQACPEITFNDLPNPNAKN